MGLKLVLEQGSVMVVTDQEYGGAWLVLIIATKAMALSIIDWCGVE